jgi:hypothetical protein
MCGNTVAIYGVLKTKTTKLNSQPAQYEKNKINKDNSGKKKGKNHVGNTIAIHGILKKKNIKLNSQSTTY